ncbi:MAG TPA: hypothetical protein PLJ35_10440 [Anaerolineae bacterium]|nr:hypothetical protein [Anaerolineae bacterium]HOQ99224.1 hypothetical protein [Anaerolineae bacterium]
MPPKPGVHSQPDAFIHAMPAYIPALHAIGVKWVSGYPQNQARGLPYISGLLILNDEETGLPLAVMDCSWITALRTGAATALAATYLAQSESETVDVLGCPWPATWGSPSTTWPWPPSSTSALEKGLGTWLPL